MVTRGNASEARISTKWTNRSVLALAQDADPIAIVIAKARALVFQAMEAGWSGPPYDPIALAGLMGIEVSPSKDVLDARTFTTGSGKFRIEFNPNRS